MTDEHIGPKWVKVKELRCSWCVHFGSNKWDHWPDTITHCERDDRVISRYAGHDTPDWCPELHRVAVKP